MPLQGLQLRLRAEGQVGRGNRMLYCKPQGTQGKEASPQHMLLQTSEEGELQHRQQGTRPACNYCLLCLSTRIALRKGAAHRSQPLDRDQHFT